ncbi:MAG: hypothetical protein ACRDY7_17645, partial [Acidimicrobiia bacterium]
MSSITAVTLVVASALWVPPPAQEALAAPGPPGLPVTAMSVEAASIAFGDFTFPVEAHEPVTLRRYVLDVGEVVDWGSEPGTVLGLVQAGRMSNYLGCSRAQLWRTPVGYYMPRSEPAGTLGGVTVNDGDEQAEILAVISGTPGAVQREDQKHRHGTEEVDPPEPAGGCPGGPAAEAVDRALARVTRSATFDQVDHNQIVVRRYTLAPGYTSGWHQVPDRGLVVQTAGTTTVSTGCNENRTYEPGRAYVHDATDQPQLVTNPGTEVAEYYA